jgi:hypothetical protein
MDQCQPTSSAEAPPIAAYSDPYPQDALGRLLYELVHIPPDRRTIAAISTGAEGLGRISSVP